ncbi:MAG: hypothetical protein K0Q90_1048 [Paenibacillaceae bacterium]|jgi:hypothetical protein|nr:hypothetical protein [Paenibacillaceae bacterium]
MVSSVTGLKKIFVGFISLALLFFYIGSSLHIAKAAMADTTTYVTASADPSVHGESVTISAIVEVVAPDIGTPTGTVTFTGAGLNETVPLDGSGTAVVTTTSLATGTVVAVYNGDGARHTSAGNTNVTVLPAETFTSVTATPDPSAYGESVLVSAQVEAFPPGSGQPTGIVTFSGPNGFNEMVVLVNGEAGTMVSTLTSGMITASYSGDSNFLPSMNGTPVAVNPASTTTTVDVTPNTAVIGESVTVTATVTPNAPATGIPSGMIWFTGPGGLNESAGLDIAGQASFTSSNLAAGTITATYYGDGNYDASTGTANLTVNAAASQTVLNVGPNPSVIGQTVIVSATVTASPPGSGTPTGTVTFTGPNGLNYTTALSMFGEASLLSDLMLSGTVTATYNGDVNYTPSTDSVPVTVNPAITETFVNATPDPSIAGTPVTLTATVTVLTPGAGIPGGTVTFTGPGVNETVNLNPAGQASTVVSTLGTGTITATYNGDVYYYGSTGTANVTTLPGALAETVTSVSASPNPAVPGQDVMLVATVLPAQPGNTPIPTGTVTFTGPNGYNQLAGVNINGEAYIFANTLVTGTITAIYNGDSVYNGSTGTTTITVDAPETTTTVTATPDPSYTGQMVTVTAIVTPVNASNPIPPFPLVPNMNVATGTVTFTGPGGLNETVALNGLGQASFTTTTLETGTITAVYNGDSQYNGSTGTTSVTVNTPETTTTLTATPDPSFAGQSVTVTATVVADDLIQIYSLPNNSPTDWPVNWPIITPTVGIPTGTVTFTGPGGLNETVALNGLGQASFTTTTLETGTITATYNGDNIFVSSTGTTPVTVNYADTVTTVTATPDQTLAGEAVTVTATVEKDSPLHIYGMPTDLPITNVPVIIPNVGIPTGTVTFTGPGGLNETVALDGLGQASFTSTTLVTGTITAAYNGDKTYNGSTGTVTVTVTVESDETSSEGTAPSSGSGGGGGAPVVPAAPGVSVLVNGKAEEAGTLNTSNVNNQTVSTLKIDHAKLETKLAAEGQGAVVTVPVTVNSDVIVTILSGQMIQQMENKQAILEIKTGQASYTLPAQQIHMSSISEKIGKSVALQDITVQILISKASADAVKAAEQAANQGNFSLVTAPVDFTITATYDAASVEVQKFDAFVQRTITVPEGVDPSRITTGVVVDADGTVRHIPTKVIVQDGKYYAVLNSMTNSAYSVVWHPLEFSDVEAHWAKAAVNDMGSRMVIQGTGDNAFSPDRNITRAEFAAIFVRGLGLKLEGAATAFSDVTASDWYSSAVQTAYSYGLISGFEDGTFRPDESITREQAMVMVSRAMQLTGLKDKLHVQADVLAAYLDAADASEWANDGIAGSVQAGLITGRDGNALAPKESITRAEVATVIQRLLQKSGLI